MLLNIQVLVYDFVKSEHVTRMNKSFYKIGEILIWSMFITAIFDAVENVALIKLLIGGSQEYWSSVAYFFAIGKFILIIISLLYLIYNIALLLFKKSS